MIPLFSIFLYHTVYKFTVNTSTESESSSEEEEVTERNHSRVEERKYHLRKTKPTVERFQAHVGEYLNCLLDLDIWLYLINNVLDFCAITHVFVSFSIYICFS